jgi:N-hydroxyarylamine O-acetyltransferase
VTQALLSHIGLHAAPAPDVDGLQRLHRAYLERVPYEALAVQLGETGPLEAEELTARVLTGRGGYCFELNTVLGALLRSVGFEVTHHQAVVGGEGPTNHMVLLVQIGGDTWIADAGLGEGFLDPLPLREGSYEIGPFTWSLEREPAGTWWLTHHRWGSFSGFRMAAEASPVVDFERHHERLATDPASSFVQTLVVQKPMSDRIRTLRARTFSELGPSVDTKREVGDIDEFSAVLSGEFGITLTDERRSRLWDAACAQHEAFLGRRAA